MCCALLRGNAERRSFGLFLSTTQPADGSFDRGFRRSARFTADDRVRRALRRIDCAACPAPLVTPTRRIVVSRKLTSAGTRPPRPVAKRSGPARATRRKRLALPDPCVLDRPNLRLAVELCDDGATKRRAVLFRLAKVAAPGGVYVATRRHAEELAELLARHGHSTAFAHGGLDAGQREAARAAFRDGEVDVLVATTALGRGLDESDVRFAFRDRGALRRRSVQDVLARGGDAVLARARGVTATGLGPEPPSAAADGLQDRDAEPPASARGYGMVSVGCSRSSCWVWTRRTTRSFWSQRPPRLSQKK